MVMKVFGVLLAIAAVSVYLTVKEEGSEQAFGGAFAPVENVRGDSTNLSPAADPLGVMVTAQSVPQTAQSNYGQLVDRVRTRVGGAMDKSVERSRR